MKDLETCSLCAEAFEPVESPVDKPPSWALFEARLELGLDTASPVCGDCEWTALVPIARGIVHGAVAR